MSGLTIARRLTAIGAGVLGSVCCAVGLITNDWAMADRGLLLIVLANTIPLGDKP